MKKKRKKLGRKLLSFLLTLAMVVGLVPGMGMTAYAADVPYASLKNTTNVVKFDGKDWYLIAYDQSTVTLLTKECVAASQYDSNDSSNIYENSTVETAVNTYYNGSISNDVKSAVVDNKMFLLTTEQANAMTDETRKCSQASGAEDNVWWLCSPGGVDWFAASVFGENGWFTPGSEVNCLLGVRPALKLNLESVTFSSVNLSGGANATASGGNTTQAYFDSGSTHSSMTTVTYTANDGYQFPKESDVYTETNGITVAVSQDQKTITVSGTPTATATSITVPDAVQSSIAVTGISLDKTTAQAITVGNSVAFTANVEPNDASDKTVRWSVGGTDKGAVKLYSDETCTTVVGADATETLTVYAKGISAGSATVICTSNANSTKSASCDVTVNEAAVTEYTIFFTDALGWGDIHVYYYGVDGAEWPGVAMGNSTVNDYGQHVYTAVIPAAVDGIIFNGNGNQTVDITSGITNEAHWSTIDEMEDNKYKVESIGGAVAPTYTVTWKSQDGTGTYETDTDVAKDTKPSYDGSEPTKAEDDNYTYTFAGWATSENQESGTAASDLPAVTDNVTYYAAFSKTQKQSSAAYASLLNTTTVVNFDGREWYLIENNSTALNAGTVTLLSKECVAESEYKTATQESSASYVEYAYSTVKTAVDNWYDGNITSNAKTAVFDNKMFLLTIDQANAMTADTRKCSQASDVGWWLCSSGNYLNTAAWVFGEDGSVIEEGGNVELEFGVRPALKLDLSKVTFDSDAKTFTVSKKSSGGGSYTPSTPSTPTTPSSTSAPAPTAAPNTPATPTVTTVPSSTAAPTEDYTVPVTNENAVNVSTSITEGNAVVSEITQSDIDKIVNSEPGTEADENTSITIDVSKAKSEVTSIELTKTTIERLADTTSEQNNSVDTVTVQMTNAKVELDAETLAAVSEQAAGKSVRLVVDDKLEQASLNEKQRDVISTYEKATTFEAYFESDGKRIHDFKGGTAKVSVRYSLVSGLLARFIHMLYLNPTGEVERFITTYDGEWCTGDLPHFSEYAIVYDTSVSNKTGTEEDAAEAERIAKDPYTGLDPKDWNADENDFVADETTILPNGKTAYENGLAINSGLRLIQKGKTLTVTWGKVKGATGYKIYAEYCGTKMPDTPIKTIKSGSKVKVVIKELHGKKLNKKKNYKVCVVAYKTVNGVDKVLGRTVTAHVVGAKNKKYSNPQKLTIVSKTKLSLKTGKSVKIISKVTLVNKKRKSLSDAHAPMFRYASTNKKVVTVNKKGKIKAVGKGQCYIWVYAKNGYGKKVKVTVS